MTVSFTSSLSLPLQAVATNPVWAWLLLHDSVSGSEEVEPARPREVRASVEAIFPATSIALWSDQVNLATPPFPCLLPVGGGLG